MANLLINFNAIGTPSYMAPELIKASKNIIPIKCDVYSYGILFGYFCIIFIQLKVLLFCNAILDVLGLQWNALMKKMVNIKL